MRKSLIAVTMLALAGCGGTEPPGNRAPEAAIGHNPAVGVGDTLRLDSLFRDPDGDTLTYQVGDTTKAQLAGDTLVIGEAVGSTWVSAVDPDSLRAELVLSVVVQTDC